MEDDAIERLLYESEGDELDFKRDQYRLTSNDEKGELVKDILAFANAWRRADAFILIGVDEAKVAGRSTPVGVATHLNDSNLQQLVNSKTNSTVVFSYETVSFKGLDLGLITIPVQERPKFLTRDFGKLKRDLVYVRRGSSTDTAGLDEVLKMRAGPATPNLQIQFADIETRKELGASLSLVSEIVDYDESKVPTIGVAPSDFRYISVDRHYKKEMAAFIADTSLLNQVGFSLFNSASTLATNVRLEMTGPTSDNVRICDEYDYPRAPAYDGLFGSHIPIVAQHNVRVDFHGNEWNLTVKFGSIQPGARVWSNGPFYIGVLQPTEIDLAGFLYADNLPSPVPVSLKIKFETKHRKLELADLERDR